MLLAGPSNCSTKKKKPDKSFPVSLKAGELLLTFWNVEQPIDQIPATQFVIKDKDQTFKIMEGKIYMAAVSERILMNILNDPYVQGELNRRKFYKN